MFTAAHNELINPQTIQLIYNTKPALPMFYSVDIWSAIMTTSVHALEIKEMKLANIIKNQTSVFFILTNAMNNILSSIQNSTEAILDETTNISDHIDSIIKILLYVASSSLLVSVCLILPVATKVDKNKDELLRHFMLIDREDVKKQLEKCRLFFNTMHDKEHVTQQNMEDIDDEEFKEGEDGTAGKDGEEGDETKQYKHKRRKNKMHKKFSSNFFTLIIEVLFVVGILEGYFLLSYFLSINFLVKIKDLINESGTITTRQFSNNFLYELMQEVLTTNGTALVVNQNSLIYVFNFLNDTIKQQEDFLKEHSNNAAYNSPTYNTFFDNLIYTDVCAAIYDPTSKVYTGNSFYSYYFRLRHIHGWHFEKGSLLFECGLLGQHAINGHRL